MLDFSPGRRNQGRRVVLDPWLAAGRLDDIDQDMSIRLAQLDLPHIREIGCPEKKIFHGCVVLDDQMVDGEFGHVAGGDLDFLAYQAQVGLGLPFGNQPAVGGERGGKHHGDEKQDLAVEALALKHEF